MVEMTDLTRKQMVESMAESTVASKELLSVAWKVVYWAELMVAL